MSVRRGLLAILDQGECYGYQLRAEYARRTGATLNVGQIYTTLDRLERDALAARRGVDDRGHQSWGITDRGRAEVRGWFDEADAPAGRDERAAKIALAATLPGVDLDRVLAAERAGALARRDALRATDADDVATAIVRAAELARVDAELAWLDAVPDLASAEPFGLTAERPKRGRPARVVAAV
ncbi:PadR family transcriptional regulator [Microbacterium sp. NPDC091313]